MAESGRERAPDTHMTDIYRRRGRIVHLSSRTGAGSSHAHFLDGGHFFCFRGGTPLGVFAQEPGRIFFLAEAVETRCLQILVPLDRA